MTTSILLRTRVAKLVSAVALIGSVIFVSPRMPMASPSVVANSQAPVRLDITGTWDSPPTWSPEFISFVKHLENSNNIGWRRGKWYPYKSFEGGLPTIGYGYKTRSKAEAKKFSKGITDKQAHQMLVQELDEAWERARAYLWRCHRVELGCLSIHQQEMLVELVFNVGNLKVFPCFTEAVIEYDVAGMANHYERSAKRRDGHRVLLSRRNDLFFERYIKEHIDLGIKIMLAVRNTIHHSLYLMADLRRGS